MKTYESMNKEELLQLKSELETKYNAFKARGLQLDMSRGKPCEEQLDIALDLMDALNSHSPMKGEDGVDCRNYGVLDGITEAKALLGAMAGADSDKVVVYGNASLSAMFDTVSRSMTHGVVGNTPWVKLDNVKFLCPVPGYDRHFTITEYFGIEMVNIPMTAEGPDMDMVEKLVSEDEGIKGIWCVPKYSNPQGIIYSDETVRRLAKLKPAAADFRIFWDNAYCVHHLYEDQQDTLLDIISECEKAGNPDMVYEFVSTSKVSFAGAGISAVISSENNLKEIKKHLFVQTIGPDKVNQLRHVRFFKDMAGIKAHMKCHADIVRPKFEAVLNHLDQELTGLEIGWWVKPRGGYFISFDAMEGCADKIVAKAKEAGVVMTGAGATFPYKKDPKNSNIRIAPTFPTTEELAVATDLFIVCVKLVSAEQLLEKMA